MDVKQMEEALLEANANPERITEKLAEVLRDLMRATAIQVHPENAIIRATENWEYLLELLKRCKEPLSWRWLFEDAVKMLRPEEAEGDKINGAIQMIADAGMSYYIENDRSAASRKQGRLMDAIRHLELRCEQDKRQITP